VVEVWWSRSSASGSMEEKHMVLFKTSRLDHGDVDGSHFDSHGLNRD